MKNDAHQIAAFFNYCNACWSGETLEPRAQRPMPLCMNRNFWI
jgi:hypothetical protein